MTEHLGINESLWVATSGQTSYPVFNRVKKYDVIIIGAGITGLLAAYYLQIAGVKVAVLEADSIIKGTSGYTTAKITLAHGLIYNNLINNFGIETAKIYAGSNQWAIGEIERIIKQYGINCDFEKTSAINYAISQTEVLNIRKEYDVTKLIGLSVSLESSSDGPVKHIGAIRYDQQAQFHPRNFLLAIASFFTEMGGEIFENTRVLEIVEQKKCEVIIQSGSITADKVIICSNNPIVNHSEISKIIFPYKSYLTAFITDQRSVNAMYYSNDEGAYSIRNHNIQGKHYLLVGGEGHLVIEEVDDRAKIKKIIAYAKKVFNVSSANYYWSAQDNISIDQLPLIGKVSSESQNIFMAAGFSAWGMTKGVVAARLLTDQILDKSNGWSDIYDPWNQERVMHREKLASGEIKTDEEGHLIAEFLRTRKESTVINLEKNSGKIEIENDKPVAYYMDEGGKTIKMSAICTHMGCTVGWNNRKKTWDCPCHGSRYDQFGRVIQGPAMKNLEVLE